MKHHIGPMARQARKQGLETPFDFRTKADKAEPTCAWPGCTDKGELKAPKSPRDMSAYIWFCADHLREHNKTWNYFEGMTDKEVEEAVRYDTVWQRPTWKLGVNRGKGAAKGFTNPRFSDAFGVLDEEAEPAPHHVHRTFAPNSPEAQAFATMDLSPPVTIDEVKACYKKLVKRHHPDANAGAKEAEEKFKEVATAYQVIIKHLEG